MFEHAVHVAADFIGVAAGIEFGLEVGAFGPFPEEFFHLVFGGVGLEDKALLFDLEATGAEVAAAQGGEVGAEAGEAGEFGFGIVLGRREGAGDGGVTDLEAADEFGADFFEGGLVEVLEEGAIGELESGLGELPVAEAGFLSAIEVLLFDRFGVELGFEQGLDFGQGVEPLESDLTGLRLVEAAVEFLANGSREAGDFADLHRRLRVLGFGFGFGGGGGGRGGGGGGGGGGDYPGKHRKMGGSNFSSSCRRY